MSVFKISQSGVGFLHGLISLGTVNSKLASMAAARVVAQYAPLPDKNCLCYKTFFYVVGCEQLDNFLGNVHSVAPIDFNAIKDYAVKFYCIRAENAVGCCLPSITGSNGIINLFHAGVHLSGEELDLLKHESEAFRGYVCGFEDIYKHLCGNN